MLFEKFNKLGGTEYRVKSQVQGYIWLAEFLLTQLEYEDIIKISSNKLDENFKLFCKSENIYSYKNDKKIKNRFNMIAKLFVQIKLLKKDGDFYIIERKYIEELLNDPYKNFFNLFIKHFKFFEEGMIFLNNNHSIDPYIFSTAILIYENDEDSFDEIYNLIENNCEELLKSLVLKKFKNENLSNISPDSYEKDFKKPSNKNKNVTKILNLLKENRKIELSDINNLLDVNLIDNHFVRIKKYKEYYKKHDSEKNKIKREEKIEFFQEYFSTKKYEDFLLDIHMIKIWKNIFDEYNDLTRRWLTDFSLIYEDKMINNFITIEENVIEYSMVKKIINEYPYSISEVEQNLLKIQEGDFNFKFHDDSLSNITNSTIAEYFVNLFVAIKNNINVNDFPNFSRTKLQPNTLYPLSHAPGKGPDMYLIKNNNLVIIETTIHKNKKSIKNNEIFNIIDHVQLDKIAYLSNQDMKNLDSTKIFLITNLNDDNDLIDIKKELDHNYINNLEKNCGIKRMSVVTNFNQLTKYEIIE